MGQLKILEVSMGCHPRGKGDSSLSNNSLSSSIEYTSQLDLIKDLFISKGQEETDFSREVYPTFLGEENAGVC
jgi:hypothetical protein